MTLRILVVTLALTQVPTSAFNPDWGVVLPPDSWPGMQRWCSRSGPALTGYWRPDPEIISAVDAALAPALAAALARQSGERSPSPSVADYHRQYIGIRANGRRAVYVNGFHRSYVENLQRARPGSANAWQTRLVTVCDGGRSFFGAEYDAQTGRIGDIHFNGRGASAGLGTRALGGFARVVVDFHVAAQHAQ
jgi:hypothetical protein